MLLIIRTTKRKGAEEAARKQREGRTGGLLLQGVRHLISCLTSSPSFRMYDNCPWLTVSNIQVNCFIFEFLSYSTCFVPLLVSQCTLSPSLSLSQSVCLSGSFLSCLLICLENLFVPRISFSTWQLAVFAVAVAAATMCNGCQATY